MKIRKIICGILTLFTLTLCIGITAAPVSAAAEVICQLKTTDTKAYINGYEIPAYSIDGKVVVIAADLKSYGLSTYYDNSDRSSNIVLKKDSAKFTPIEVSDDGRPAGTVISDVYKSDITVKINGNVCTGYNTGGKMAVNFSDLKTFGEYYESRVNKTCIIMIDGLQLNKDCGTALRFPLKDKSYTYESWLPKGADNICKDFAVSKKNPFSICITDSRANDLRIVKKYKGEPNTLYVVSADVKTENIVNHENPNNPMGANISVGDYKCSASILGTSDWKTLRVLVRTDSEGYINVSLNLGYWENTCTGTAWFDNVRLTELSKYNTEDNTWKFLTVIAPSTSIDTYDKELGKNISLHYKMSDEEVRILKKDMETFEADMVNITGGLAKAEVDVVVCDKNLDKYTKPDGNGYYINANEAYEYCVENNISLDGYDHLFIIVNLPSLPVDYFGLGGMYTKNNIGYAFIRFYGEDTINWTYDDPEAWPPSVYVHEFLHYIESYSHDLGFEIGSIHDAEKFGYKDVHGWREFYSDFMTKNVVYNGKKLGVEPIVWNAAPHKLK